MKIIVIGCTHAGTIAATEILKNHPDADVTIYERHNNSRFFPVGSHFTLMGKLSV
jgi:2-polyprenyl-6-methoxyphenol hydroxylase-like FAD-dependent oxidoreductase